MDVELTNAVLAKTKEAADLLFAAYTALSNSDVSGYTQNYGSYLVVADDLADLKAKLFG